MEEPLLVRIWISNYSMQLYYSRMRYSPESAKRNQERLDAIGLKPYVTFVTIEEALVRGAWPEP